jgi:hypothetical protein
MTYFKIRLVAVCAALLLPTFAFASADMYLEVKAEKGEMHVVHCADGSCVIPPLAAGNYTVLVCDAHGKVVPTDIKLEYSVVGPRDHASGQATGKRVHSDITISKRLVAGAKPSNQIAIDEAGAQLAIGVSDDAVEAAQAKITKSRSNIQNN